MEVIPYLKLMVQKQASDLFFSTGTRVHLKIDGRMIPVGDEALKSAEVKTMIYSVLNDKQIADFERDLELNMGLSVAGLGRFRVNVFKQRGDVAMVVRYIKFGIPSVTELKLPPILEDLVMLPRGLILVVGATGSGKSTTLASMIQHRNQNRSGHILTIEDPIEFLFRHDKSVVNQREVGLDTQSFHNALRNAMREAPDVIMIGEIRDLETMQAAIAYAETGHLCLSTLHANNANQALDRIKNFFPDTAHKQLYMDLSLNLKAVVSQRLLRGVDGGRLPAAEVMLLTSYVSELILKGDTHGLKEAMEQSTTRGMQTFDQCLFDLYKSGRITLDDALQNADSRNDLALKVRMNGGPSNI
jgi:twitching motility protein PilU